MTTALKSKDKLLNFDLSWHSSLLYARYFSWWHHSCCLCFFGTRAVNLDWSWCCWCFCCCNYLYAFINWIHCWPLALNRLSTIFSHHKITFFKKILCSLRQFYLKKMFVKIVARLQTVLLNRELCTFYISWLITYVESRCWSFWKHLHF